MIGNTFQKCIRNILQIKNVHLNEIINNNKEFPFKSNVYLRINSTKSRYFKDLIMKNTHYRNISTKSNEIQANKLATNQLNRDKLNSNLAREFIKTLSIEERQIIKQELDNLENENKNSDSTSN